MEEYREIIKRPSYGRIICRLERRWKEDCDPGIAVSWLIHEVNKMGTYFFHR